MPDPLLIPANADDLLDNPSVQRLVAEVRAASDACVFLSGGAGNMAREDAAAVRAVLDALALVQRRGVRIAVGDGGTQAGVMEAAGLVRAASGFDFPLVGVAPASEVPPRGQTPLDPHHSHILLVDNPAWPAGAGGWGSETVAMARLFDVLADGRPSVAVVANGGAIALREIAGHVRAGRRAVLLGGTGRAADALAARVRTGRAAPGPPDDLARLILSLDLMRRPDLFVIVPVSAGPATLADVLVACLHA